MQNVTNNAAANDTTYWCGAKFVEGRNLAEVAKLVRADIKAAMVEGVLPGGLTARVTIARYSMGERIAVEVTAVPVGFTVLSRRRIRTEIGNKHGQLPAWMAPVAAGLLEMLENMVKVYCDGYGPLDRRGSTDINVFFQGDIVSEQRAQIRAAILAESAAVG